MITHKIVIRVNGVKQEELNDLKDYLDNHYWDWKEVTEETINQESKNKNE